MVISFKKYSEVHSNKYIIIIYERRFNEKRRLLKNLNHPLVVNKERKILEKHKKNIDGKKFQKVKRLTTGEVEKHEIEKQDANVNPNFLFLQKIICN